MYTVWYCVSGSAIMFCDKRLWKLSLEEARKVTIEDFKQNHWFLKQNPDGWLEIRDRDFAVVHTTRRVLKQISLFGG